MPRPGREAPPPADSATEHVGSRTTLRQVLPQLRRIVDPTKSKDPSHITQLGIALLQLWARPYQTYTEQYKNWRWFQASRDQLGHELDVLLTGTEAIETESGTVETKLRSLAGLLMANSFTFVAYKLQWPDSNEPREQAATAYAFAHAVQTTPDLERLAVPAGTAAERDRRSYKTWCTDLRLVATVCVLGGVITKGLKADWRASKLALDQVQPDLGDQMQKWYDIFRFLLPEETYDALDTQQVKAWNDWVGRMHDAIKLVRRSVVGNTEEDEVQRVLIAAYYVLAHQFESLTHPPDLLPYDRDSLHHLLRQLPDPTRAMQQQQQQQQHMHDSQAFPMQQPQGRGVMPAAQHVLPPIRHLQAQPYEHWQDPPSHNYRAQQYGGHQALPGVHSFDRDPPPFPPPPLPRTGPAAAVGAPPYQSHPYAGDYNFSHPARASYSAFSGTLGAYDARPFQTPHAAGPLFGHTLRHPHHGNTPPGQAPSSAGTARPQPGQYGWSNSSTSEHALGFKPRIARRIGRTIYGVNPQAWERSRA
ncbi:hypothetical protein JCM10908_001951 [Rhodotorula pacifica]|uniref:uncharacterized protein n=1 Tax=Rhodotorula pacifica TaxID=1495444 RepID=UPI00316EDD4C